MMIVCTLLSSLAVILNSIELTSQFECLPNGAPIPGVSCVRTSYSPDRWSPERTLPLARSSSDSSRSPDKQPLRVRTRGPYLKQTYPSILGHKFEDLAFTRLSPLNNPNRIFELRRYVFPPDKPIRVRTRFRVLNPMPTEEQFVLSTSEGDVCAILERSSNRHTYVRPILSPVAGGSKRMKINMNSGVVKELTAEEIAECPVSTKELITKNYRVLKLGSQSEHLPDIDPNSGVHRCGPSSSSTCPDRDYPDTALPPAMPYSFAKTPRPSNSPSRARSKSLRRAEPSLYDLSISPTLRQTFPRVLGYRFEDLEFIRLSPYNNPNLIFELRRFAFSPDNPIRLRTRTRNLIPMPTEEQIVLSTAEGDVCAIMEKSKSKHTVLRAIFKPVSGPPKRAKINMNSGAVEELTTEEIAECPVTSKELITKNYKVSHV